VRRHLARGLPYWLHRIELRRVCRESKQFNPIAIPDQPFFALLGEVVARSVVDDEEDLLTSVLGNKALEEREERLAIEYISKPVGEAGSPKFNASIQMSGLALAEGIYARLRADASPGLVERAVEPEAGFVFEEHNTSTPSRFFLIAGNRFLIQ